MNYAYYCNTCKEMFEEHTANNLAVICPHGQGHEVEYAGPIYFDLDDLDTGEEPPLQIGSPPQVSGPGLVSTPKVSPPLPVSTSGTELGPPVMQKVEDKPEPKKPLSFAHIAKGSSSKPIQPQVTTPTVKKVLKEIPVASHAATTLTGKLLEDYNTIMKVVFDEPGATTKIQWTANTGFGPTVRIQTKLKRNEPNAQLLYARVREALHGKRIPGSKGLTFYVGSLCPRLKAGFRISSHKGNDHKGLAILHVETN
jgi:hypothetical protein